MHRPLLEKRKYRSTLAMKSCIFSHRCFFPNCCVHEVLVTPRPPFWVSWSLYESLLPVLYIISFPLSLYIVYTLNTHTQQSDHKLLRGQVEARNKRLLCLLFFLFLGFFGPSECSEAPLDFTLFSCMSGGTLSAMFGFRVASLRPKWANILKARCTDWGL